MFLEFFGLREQPFGVTPDPRFLYLTPTHREALASLYYGVEAGRGFLSLIAPPGMGKTTILFQLLERFHNVARTAFLFQTQCDSREFIRFLLAELGIDGVNVQDRVRLHEEFNDILIREMKAGKRFIVVIDEAQNLDDSVLETVRLLSNFETPRKKLMQIILSGQPELADKLASPHLSQLRQRLSIVARLQPLSPAQVHEFIRHRLKIAGYTGPRLFSPEAEACIMQRSEGIPRTINNLCFNSLSMAYALGKKEVDRSIVEEVGVDLSLESMQSRPAFPQYSIPFRSERVESPLPQPMYEGPEPALQDAMQGWDKPLGTENVRAKDNAAANAELEKLVEEVNAAAAREAAQADQERRPEAVAAANAAAASSAAASNAPEARETSDLAPAAPVASTFRDRETATRPPVAKDPDPLRVAPPPVRPRPRPTLATAPPRPLQVVASNRRAPRKSSSTLRRLGKPLIFAVLAVDIALGAVFIIHQRFPTNANANQQPPMSASVTASEPVSNSTSAPSPATTETSSPEPVQAPREEHTLVSDETERASPNSPLPIRVSVPEKQMRENAIHIVPPVMPERAKSELGEGTVHLKAVINHDGSVRSVRLVDGSPLLSKAAMDAVMQWRFRPYMVNGQPADVDTQVTVNFGPSGNTGEARVR
jgi:general secretion pathway protein A